LFPASFFQQDEAFAAAASFEKTLGFLTYLSREAENLSLEEDILLIAVKEGVYLRARNRWAAALLSVAAGKAELHFPIKTMSVNEWTRITRQYRDPEQSAGDRALGFWRVGF